MKKRFWISLTALLIASPLFYSCQNVTRSFSNSETLYASKCSSCHNLIEPDRFDGKTWQRYIDKYGKEMTNEEKSLLLAYLTGSQ